MELIWKYSPSKASPLQTICYVPRVNAFVCSSANGILSVHAAYSGSLMYSNETRDLAEGVTGSPKNIFIPFSDEKIILQYFEPRDSIIIARGSLFNVRLCLEELFLVSDILEPPVKDPKSVVRLELTPDQASLFTSAINSGVVNLREFENAGLKTLHSERQPQLNVRLFAH